METVSQVFGIVPPKPPKSTLIGHVCSNPKLMMGVELEIEACPQSSDWYYEHLRQAIWTVDRDGSLRPPDSSFEFISKPLLMEAMLAELTEFFGKNPFDERNYSDRCSVHIHTNVCDYTRPQIASLALVYSVLEDVLFHFVNTFKCPSPEGYYRDTNLYCIPWVQCRMNFGLVNTIFADPVNAFRHWQKYTALNLLPIVTKGTVEWRHMHGTNDMEKLKIWLNVIGSIMDFVKRVEFEDVVRTIKTLNDTSAYQQFFQSVLQGYLPYEEAYAAAMADGVIHAKYSMINWEKLQGKSKPKVKILTPQEIQAQLTEIQQRYVNVVAAEEDGNFPAALGVNPFAPRPARLRRDPQPAPFRWDGNIVAEMAAPNRQVGLNVGVVAQQAQIYIPPPDAWLDDIVEDEEDE